MKKLNFLIFLLIFVVTASFGEVSLDIGMFGATEPIEGYLPTFLAAVSGLGGGIGVDVTSVGKLDLQVRMDIMQHVWGEKDWITLVSGMFVKNEYSRIPIFVGVKLSTPKKSLLSLYVDAGPEISSDKKVIDEKHGERSVEYEKTNLGFSLGGGIELYKRSLRVGVGINTRIHFIDNQYISFGLVLVVK
jgi:hypothetical protein